MMFQAFSTAGKIVFGSGALNELGSLCRPLARKVLIVTGKKAVKEAGYLDRVLALLSGADVAAVVFDQVEPEPSLATVERGRQTLHGTGCDGVIGLGGGSAIDVAKAVAGLARETAPVIEYFRGRVIEAEPLPWIAIPTTAGTGAEVTPNAVLTDREQGVKKSIRDRRWVARVALVDPELTLSMPPKVTAYSGMDALTQAIEAYTSRHSGPLTDALSFDAAMRIATYLPRAYTAGDDLLAREQVAAGSLMAGMALAVARLGAVHGMAHAVGETYGIPHGLVCAVLLPAVMEYNCQTVAAKYARLAVALGLVKGEKALARVGSGDSWEMAAAKELIGYIRKLNQEFDIPTHLGALGLQEADIPRLVEESLPSGSLKANPRPASAADLEHLLRQQLR